ncbi:hypothetical protein U732_64 [Clostridium argentinense CDC 2741]|uniref:Uncharacterized protein n=2 Tax=Clostridium argentinense TaxID=29341 RepID=A0A0C1TY82_9CLOT|nr:hypothetical protein [Clostridium argentinense]KIE44308.1 hypothetical protein U732_64 [Clostridium argentinense CDC 2741]BBB39251.1 hypothetical protein [Clostridium argentinense]
MNKVISRKYRIREKSFIWYLIKAVKIGEVFLNVAIFILLFLSIYILFIIAAPL